MTFNMSLTIEQILEAAKQGYEPIIIINGEYYDLEMEESNNDE